MTVLKIELTGSTPYSPCINGKLYTHTAAHQSDTHWILDTRNEALWDELAPLSIGQVREHLFMFFFDLRGLECQPLESGYLHFDEDWGDFLELRKTWALVNWQHPYTIGQFAQAVKRAAASFDEFKARGTSEGEEDSFTLGIEFPLQDSTERLEQVLARVRPHAQQVFARAQADLHASISANVLVNYFNFPAATRTACVQYLTYFTQFLQDLGIEATAELKQQTEQILFTVVPASGVQALRQIEAALQIYLGLPTALPVVAIQGGHQDVALQQLRMVVEHLRAQVALQRVQLGLKDATIEQLQLTNYQYRQSLPMGGASMIVASSKNPNENADSEPLVGDVVRLRKLTFKGLEIDLPEPTEAQAKMARLMADSSSAR